MCANSYYESSSSYYTSNTKSTFQSSTDYLNSLNSLTTKPQSKDDMLLDPYYALSKQTLPYLNGLTNSLAEDGEERAEKLPFSYGPSMGLRHAAQQIMIKNMIRDLPGQSVESVINETMPSKRLEHRGSLMSSISFASSEVSSQSTESMFSNTPVSPTTSEFWPDILDSLHSSNNSMRDSILSKPSKQFRERFLSHASDNSLNLPSEYYSSSVGRNLSSVPELLKRQRSASIATMDTLSSHIDTPSPKFNSKTAMKSGMKAAQLLGIEQMAKCPSTGSIPSIPKEKLPSRPATRTVSMTSTASSDSNSSTKSGNLTRKSSTASQIKNLVNSKFGSKKSEKTYGFSKMAIDISLKQVTKGNSADLQGWVDLYRKSSNGLLSKKQWKPFYLILKDNLLYKFEDHHPTTITSYQFMLQPSSIICVSEAFTNDKWVIEIANTSNNFFLRFANKLQFNNWLSQLKQASLYSKPEFALLTNPTPHSPLSMEFKEGSYQFDCLSSSTLNNSFAPKSPIKIRHLMGDEDDYDFQNNHLNVPILPSHNRAMSLNGHKGLDMSMYRPKMFHRPTPTTLAYPTLTEVPEY